MKILWSPLALSRLQNIVEYISLDNKEIARKWAIRIFDSVKILEQTPDLGRIVPEMNQKDIRELIINNYRIIYRVEHKQISILTVRHGKQLLPEEELSESSNPSS